jgi:DNA invertase Pin-like site-specific DNA recombinase
MESKDKAPRISLAALTLENNKAEILELLKLGVSVTKIAERFAISRPTLYAFFDAIDAKSGDDTRGNKKELSAI